MQQAHVAKFNLMTTNCIICLPLFLPPQESGKCSFLKMPDNAEKEGTEGERDPDPATVTTGDAM